MNNFEQEYAKIMDERRHNGPLSGALIIAATMALIGITIVALAVFA